MGLLPSVYGDRGPYLCDKSDLDKTKPEEVALENISPDQVAMKLPTCSQKANKSSLSGQGHLPHSLCVIETLGTVLSDQRSEESLLSPSKDIENPQSAPGALVQEPTLSTPRPQDTLLTILEPLKGSISVYDPLSFAIHPRGCQAFHIISKLPETIPICPGGARIFVNYRIGCRTFSSSLTNYKNTVLTPKGLKGIHYLPQVLRNLLNLVQGI